MADAKTEFFSEFEAVDCVYTALTTAVADAQAESNGET